MEAGNLRILAIIPARGGSKRIPRKNIRLLHGRPLLEWTAQFAAEVKGFSRTVLSTDDPEILSVGRNCGLDDHGLRPDSLAGDMDSSLDVALYELDQAAQRGQCYDAVALLQPTSPYRRKERWEAAFAYLDEGSAQAVVSVAPAPVAPEYYFRRADDGGLTPLMPEGLRTRSQDVARHYYVNGALYLVRAQALRDQRSFFASPLKSVVCDDPRESIDLDTEQDWLEAEQLLAAV